MIPTESPMQTRMLAAMTMSGWRAQKVPHRVNALTMPSSSLTPAIVSRLNFSRMVWLRDMDFFTFLMLPFLVSPPFGWKSASGKGCVFLPQME